MVMNMKIAICDDIKEYRNTIKCYVHEFFKMKDLKCEVNEFDNGKALLMSDNRYDILFLDIELGDINGIEIAKQIQTTYSSTIILIITSHNEYLDDAMDIKVTRYIDKPISQTRVFSALNKSLELINQQFIVLHTIDNRIVRIKVTDIVYAEAKLKRVSVATLQNGIITIKESLKVIRNKLPETSFATPHNSYVVNLDHIGTYRRDELIMVAPYNKVRITVTSRKQTAFKRQFLSYIGEGGV